MMESPQRAANVRPPDASLIYSFTLNGNKRAFWLLQIPATLMFFVFGWLLVWVADQIRPELFQGGFFVILGEKMLLPILVGSVLIIVLHELVHGLFFWLFTRTRPRFGFRSGFAYACAPGWYFPRWQYVIIGLAPFILLSLVGIALVTTAPSMPILAGILFGMTTNAAGAFGDLWIVFKVLTERRMILVEDLGDGFKFYALS